MKTKLKIRIEEQDNGWLITATRNNSVIARYVYEDVDSVTSRVDDLLQPSRS